MDIETSEQLAFIPEQVESILMTVVDGILRTEVYLEEKVRNLISFFCIPYEKETLRTLCVIRLVSCSRR